MPQYPREQPIIEVKNIRKEYPLEDETVVALKRINLNIYRGEICCIFGTSGSGKEYPAQPACRHGKAHPGLCLYRRCAHLPPA